MEQYVERVVEGTKKRLSVNGNFPYPDSQYILN